MDKNIESLCTSLDKLSLKIKEQYANDANMTENFGWNHPALTSNDLAEIPKSISNMLREINPLAIDELLRKKILDVPGKIALIERQNLPYFYNGHGTNAIPAFLAFIEWLRILLQPIIGPNQNQFHRATIEQQKQLAEQVLSKLSQFLTISIEQLTREADLGKNLSFKKGEPVFVRIIELFKKVKSTELFDTPYSTLFTFSKHLDHAISIFDQIKSFDPNTNNPANKRDNLITQLENNFDLYFSTSIPVLTVSLLTTNDLSIEKSKLNDVLKEIEQEKEKTKSDSSKYLDEIKDVLSKARQAAVEVGVAQHNMIFKAEADEHKALSNTWLKWTITVLIAITIVGIGLLFIPFDEGNTHYLIHFTITKIVILTVMFYALTICMRNYIKPISTILF